MKQQFRLLPLALLPIIAIAIFTLFPATPAEARPPRCTPVKQIDNLQSERVLESRGFHVHEAGPGSVDFHGRGAGAIAELNLPQLLPADPQVPVVDQLNAARITEAGQGARCWQPTEAFDVVAEFEIRFTAAVTPPGVTETAFLWNAPLEADVPEPLTAFGVTRNQLLVDMIEDYDANYSAAVAQDLDLLDFGGYLEVAPMGVDPTEWHTVRITMSMDQVVIEAAQDGNFETVLKGNPPGPIEPLIFEFSLDNEVFPGFYAPVSVPDTLEIESLSIRRVPAGE